MNYSLRFFLALAVTLVALPAGTFAHFKLLEPRAWINFDEARGNPQKVGPCGGDPKGQNEKLVSGVVTKMMGGSKFHLKIEETVFHPGHYRVALSLNSRNELPPDPMTFERYTDRGLYSVWGAIQSPPQIPVIADGLFPHYKRPADLKPGQNWGQVWEADIELPNISCARCTLQVIQFMADHVYNQPGGYSYHHCADLAITADTSKPLSKGWPTVSTSN